MARIMLLLIYDGDVPPVARAFVPASTVRSVLAIGVDTLVEWRLSASDGVFVMHYRMRQRAVVHSVGL